GPFVVTVSVFDDPNSNFVGAQQPPIVTQIVTQVTAVVTQTTGNGFQSIATPLGVTFIPIGSVTAVTPQTQTSASTNNPSNPNFVPLSLLFTPPVVTTAQNNALAFTPITQTAKLSDIQNIELNTALVQSTTVDERLVFLQVVDSKGEVTDEV